MTIPDFDARGLLPPFVGADPCAGSHPSGHLRSPYRATSIEVVEKFSTSITRCNILKGFLSYRGLLAALGFESGIQFLNGSFSENIELIEQREPNDLDVFSFLHIPDVYKNDRNAWDTKGLVDWQNEIVDHVKNKARFKIDSYAVLITNPMSLLDACLYWSSLFGHRRNTLAWKGFIIVELNEADDQQASKLLVQKLKLLGVSEDA